MLKEIKYETKKFEDVVLDLADEIKNGWNIVGFRYPEISFSVCTESNITIEITLRKEF